MAGKINRIKLLYLTSITIIISSSMYGQNNDSSLDSVLIYSELTNDVPPLVVEKEMINVVENHKIIKFHKRINKRKYVDGDCDKPDGCHLTFYYKDGLESHWYINQYLVSICINKKWKRLDSKDIKLLRKSINSESLKKKLGLI